MSEAPNSLSPVQQAEAKARAAGYVGTWPPPPRPRVTTAAELQAVLNRLDAGELSANVVASAGDHLIQFFGALDPEAFRLLGETLARIVLWHGLSDAERRGYDYAQVAPRVQIRAVQACLKPMLQVIDLIPKLARQQRSPSPLLAHLYRCVLAFLAPLGAERMGRIANVLVALATNPRAAETAVRAAQAASELVLKTLDVVATAQLGLERVEIELDADELQRARADLQAIEARAEEKARRWRGGQNAGAGSPAC